MALLAQLLSGYSLFCALAVALTHFSAEHYREQPRTRVVGLLLLLVIAVLQAMHAGVLAGLGPWTDSALYRMALFAVAPCFFLYSRPVLRPEAPSPSTGTLLLHLLPTALAPLMATPWARPLAFLVGAGYLLWLGRTLLPLRAERVHFPAEAGLLGTAIAIATGVAVLAFLPDLLPEALFVALHAAAIGLALLLVQIALGRRPALPAEVQDAAREAARARYASTTLAKVDCDQALARLAALMRDERLFVDAELSLPGLAGRLGLSGHQLSELLNDRLGKGFARYLRELRVDAAQAMLLAEPSASVLSVGLSVGFTTQSNFYEAFREIAGTTPGRYRKLHIHVPE